MSYQRKPNAPLGDRRYAANRAMVAVCSARVRASTQSVRGNQWWRRDPYHLRRPLDAELTLCGCNCSDWLVIGPVEEPDANCCKRCIVAGKRQGAPPA